MKTIVCTILSLFTVTIVCGQKIVINEVDKFTGCKIVETSVLKTSRPNVDYKLRTFNDTLYICASVKNQSIRAKENDRSKLYLLIVKTKNRLYYWELYTMRRSMSIVSEYIGDMAFLPEVQKY